MQQKIISIQLTNEAISNCFP